MSFYMSTQFLLIYLFDFLAAPGQNRAAADPINCGTTALLTAVPVHHGWQLNRDGSKIRIFRIGLFKKF